MFPSRGALAARPAGTFLTRWRPSAGGPGTGWPLVLLVASVALIGAAAANVRQALQSQQAVADSALRDYASFAAWSYQQHVREQLGRAAKEALGPVYHGHYLYTVAHVPTPAEVALFLPWDSTCACHRARVGETPRAYISFLLGGDTVNVATNAFRDPDHGWRTDAGPSDAAVAARRWVRDTLSALIHSGYRSEWGFAYVVRPSASDASILSYTIMPTVWRDTVVYVAEYAPSAFAGMLADAFDEEGLLPWTLTHGRPARALLAGEVLDLTGRPLFASSPHHYWRLDARQDFPASFGGIIAHVEVRPELGTKLVIGGLPRSRLPFLLTLLALAGALSVVAAMQLRREGELARLRSHFVANVSHELRTPLAQIRLDLDTLRLGRCDSEELYASILARIDRETRRLTHLADNVLRLSRQGRADVVGVRGPVDIGHEVAEIVEEFRALAAARGVRIETAVESTPPVPLEADALRQLLLNLLDNAVKYGPAGQTIVVTVTELRDAVRVAVDDHGPGVPADERDRIWHPFVRGSSSLRRGIGGSGIGLTIVRDIVARHGGRAWVSDAPGGGASFAVEFPVPAAAADRDAGPAPPTGGLAPGRVAPPTPPPATLSGV